jgi:hypothetical protein
MTGRRNGNYFIPVAAAALVFLVACGSTSTPSASGPAPTTASVAASSPALSTLTPPKPTVPEVFTLEGQFVRVAYNNEGYAVLGYRYAQQEAGEEWMLLDVGLTVRPGVKDYTVRRPNFTLKTPDGKVIPLPTQAEFMKVDLRALVQRANMYSDSINYFPTGTNYPCSMRFFAQLGSPGIALDQFDLSSNRACVGRLFFPVAGNIKAGQYWLDVQFQNSVVEVPFRVFTPEEQKEFAAKWQEFKKAHDASYQ